VGKVVPLGGHTHRTASIIKHPLGLSRVDVPRAVSFGKISHNEVYYLCGIVPVRGDRRLSELVEEFWVHHIPSAL
jgi:hypothetical protein